MSAAAVAPFRRVERKKFGKAVHHYETLDGQRIPGVTTILSDAVPKPALVGWGIKSVAEFAVDHWDELAGMPPAKRLAALKGAPYADRDAAANKGTEIHALAARLVAGEEVDVPEALAGHVDSYIDFLDKMHVKAILVEFAVYHSDWDYAGTADLLADIGPDRWLLDVKTSRSGVFTETAWQLAAYAAAEVYMAEDGTVAELPSVRRIGAVWVRSDGWDLLEAPRLAQHKLDFKILARSARLLSSTADVFTTVASGSAL